MTHAIGKKYENPNDRELIAVFPGCLFFLQCEDVLLLNSASVQTYIIMIIVSRKKK